HVQTRQIQEDLLAYINAAYYAREQHVPFSDWDMLCEQANTYLETQLQSYCTKWIVKNFPQKLSPKAQAQLLRKRIGPASYQQFVGMEAELTDLYEQLIAPGPPWIIVLAGLGGMGKTSIAHRLASTIIEEQSFDNVGWVRVRHANSEFEKWRRANQKEMVDTDMIFDHLLEQLAPNVYHYSTNSSLTTLELLQTRLTAIPHLVVIDNIETIEGIDTLITQLDSLTNPTKFLLTSRIDLPNEPSLYSYRLSGLTDQDALKLLRNEGAIRNVPRIHSAPDEILTPIYHATGGNPLALRLVVGQAISKPFDVILDEISQYPVDQTEAFFDFVFADMWEQLNSQTKALLINMLLTTNYGVHIDFLSAITQQSLPEVRATLTQLVAFNLVNSNDSSTSDAERYTVHSLIRTYLRHRLPLLPSDLRHHWQTAITQSSHYLQQQIQATPALLSPEDQEQALHVLRMGFDDLQFWHVVRPLLLQLAPKMEQAGQRELWVSYLTRGIAFSNQLEDLAAEAELRFHLGTLYQRRSNHPMASAEFQMAADLFAILAQSEQQATAINRQAYVARLQRNFDQAQQLANQALSLLNEEQAERAYSFLVLGTVQLDLRNFDEAERLLRHSLAIWMTAGDHRMTAWCLTNLGAVLRPLQRYAEAIELYQQAIRYFEKAHDPIHLAVVWMNLGNVYLLQSKLRDALGWYEKAHAVFTRFQEQLRLAQIQTNMGMAYFRLEQWELAETLFSDSIDQFTQIGNIGQAANGMDALGLTLMQQARWEEAIQVFQQGIEQLHNLEHQSSYEKLLKELQDHLQEAIEGQQGGTK
ncbi:MAG: tetratricopeptide repeat protein, partial [Caldilineaceae bacterium]|nr:tetratricopeptide repeat protein [Caldilineaceae bacterium]